MQKPKAVVFDFDGTLAHIAMPGHRFNWDDTEACEAIFNMQSPNWPIIELMKTYSSLGYLVIIATGRPEKFRSQTSSMAVRFGCNWDAMLMRSDTDTRHDWQVKLDMAMYIGAKLDIAFWVDDRQSVVDALRSLAGITVLQCAKGDY